MTSATVPVARRRSWRPARRTVLYALLALLTLAFLVPLIWMLLTSLKTDAEATLAPPTVIPKNASTDAYNQILDSGGRFPVIRWFFNSVIAGLANSLLVVATAAPAAYALARLEFRGKRVAYALIVATLFIPPIIFLAPNYLIVDKLGWLDTLLAVIVPPAASAFGVFFMRQFFLGIPVELEEAARLDGASRWRIFWSVVLPLSKPALVTLGMLALLTNWNDFLWPVYVLFNPDHLTLGPGLLLLQSAQTTHYPLIMAGGVLACIPILIVFVLAQRFIIEGIARTGIKG